jgi:hypothetical protein
VWFARDRISVAGDVDPTTGTAYCADLKKVMVEARRDFTSIMGREVSKVIWTARIQLPGWDNCIVSDWTTQGKIIRYYGCEIPSVPTAEEMHAKRDTAVSYLESCLWQGLDQNAEVGNETNFELGSNDSIGRISETAHTDGRGNILRIEVDVPSSLIRAAPAEAVSDKPAPTPPQPANQAETYCEDMKRAVAAAPSNFDAILGPPVSGESAWVSRVQLPDWESCEVRHWTSEGKTKRYFTCVRGPFPTLEALRAKREEADAYVKPCLGLDWSVRRQTLSDNTMRSIYFMGPDDPEVLMREAYSEQSKLWFLRLDVDAPASLATRAPETTAEQPVPPPGPETTPQQPAPPPPPPPPPETSPEAPNQPIAPPSTY